MRPTRSTYKYCTEDALLHLASRKHGGPIVLRSARCTLHTAQAPDMPPDVIANLTACATALNGTSATQREDSEAAAMQHSDDADDDPVLLPQPITQPTMPKPKRKHSSDEVSTAQLSRRKLNAQPSDAPAAADGAQSVPSHSSKVKRKKRSRSGENTEAVAEAPAASRQKVDSQPAAPVQAPDGATGDQNMDSSGSARKKKKRRRESEVTAAASAAPARSPAAPESQALLKDGDKSQQADERAPKKKRKKVDESVKATAANDTAVPQPAAKKSSKRKSISNDTSTVAEADTQPRKKKKNTKT